MKIKKKRVLVKVFLELLYDWGITHLAVYLEKTVPQKDTSSPMFKAALFRTCNIWKQLKYPSNVEWRIVFHVYNGILLS